MDQQQPIVAKAEMLIRKPVADVFRAFVEPEITNMVPDRFPDAVMEHWRGRTA